MVDRIQHPGAGLDGGAPGGLGEFRVRQGTPARPKALVSLDATARVELNPPGGGGYGDPHQREPDAVLADVVNGYVSLEAAARDYGVVIEYLGTRDQLVRLPEDYRIDQRATQARSPRDRAVWTTRPEQVTLMLPWLSAR